MFLNKELFYLILLSKDNMLYYYSPEQEVVEQIMEEPIQVDEVFFRTDRANEFLVKKSDGKLLTFISMIRCYDSQINVKIINEYESFEEFEQEKGSYFEFFNEKQFKIFEFVDGLIYGMDKNEQKQAFFLDTHSFKLGEQRKKVEKQSSNETIGGTEVSLDVNQEIHQKNFFQCLALRNFSDAFPFACLISDEYLKRLAKYSLQHLDLETAKNCYKKLGLLSQIQHIQSIHSNKDTKILKGQIASFFGEQEKALELFFSGNRPDLVVKMMRSNHQYKEALEVCSKFDLKETTTGVLLDIADNHYQHEEFIKAD